MQVVWKFFCGLVKIHSKNSVFKAIVDKTLGNLLFHIQCAYESQQPLACAQLLKSVCYHVQLSSMYLTTPDFTVVGYVLNNSVLPTRLSITKCNINSEAINVMVLEMHRNEQTVRIVDFEANPLDSSGVKCLESLLIKLRSCT